MSIPSQLRRTLQEILGADAADLLVNRLELVDANRGDIGELRHEMQLGFERIDARFQLVDARFQLIEASISGAREHTDGIRQHMDRSLATTRQHLEALIDGGNARMEALLQKGLREQMRFFFLAWSVLLSAIVGLYAR